MDAAIELMNGLGGRNQPEVVTAGAAIGKSFVDQIDDPILDPARVLATAVEIMKHKGWGASFHPRNSCFAVAMENEAFGSKPYPLKGANSDGE